MNMKDIDRLKGLAPPPKIPHYNTGDWNVAEEALDLILPDDYKLLITSYGQGEFSGFQQFSGIFITSLLGRKSTHALAESTLAYFETIATPTYELFPRPQGLLGIGTYKDVDTFAWRTVGSPNEWPIVYHDVETGFHEINNMGILEFVISVLEETSPLHESGIIKMGEMKGPHSFLPDS